MFPSLGTIINALYCNSSYFPMRIFPITNLSEAIIEDRDDPRLFDSAYQIQYSKNFDELKPKFKTTLCRTISFVAIKKFTKLPFDKRRYVLVVHQSN